MTDTRTPPMPTNKPEVVLPELPELISSLQSMRDRMMAALPAKFGDGFDGDFDVLLEAINTLKRLAAYGQARIDTLTRPADGERMPTVPQAFFDEFGVNADDRVMDYGQACYDAGALSAAPQQPGQEVDDGRLPEYARSHEGQRLYSLAYSRGRKKGREDVAAQPHQTAEAVADIEDAARELLAQQLESIGYPKSAEDLRAGASIEEHDALSACIRAIAAALRTTPPAIDIGKLLSDEVIDVALFDSMDDESAMLIDYMGMGNADKLEKARAVLRSALTAALGGGGGERADG